MGNTSKENRANKLFNEYERFDQTSFYRLRNKLKTLDDKLFVIFGLVHLGDTGLKDCNRHLKFSLKQIESILSDYEKTRFPHIG